MVAMNTFPTKGGKFNRKTEHRLSRENFPSMRTLPRTSEGK